MQHPTDRVDKTSLPASENEKPETSTKEILIKEIRDRRFDVPWTYERKFDNNGVDYYPVYAKGGRLVLTTKFEHGASRIIQIVHQLAGYV